MEEEEWLPLLIEICYREVVALHTDFDNGGGTEKNCCCPKSLDLQEQMCVCTFGGCIETCTKYKNSNGRGGGWRMQK